MLVPVSCVRRGGTRSRRSLFPFDFLPFECGTKRKIHNEFTNLKFNGKKFVSIFDERQVVPDDLHLLTDEIKGKCKSRGGSTQRPYKNIISYFLLGMI